jgi:heme-degrading monooxygenase HmoA
MFAVIFEVRPHAHRFQGYLDIARMLRPELEKIEGFLENTRYRSRTREGVLLSLSLWRDEKAVIRWRTHAAHYAGQAQGRREILADYRLRVGELAFMARDGVEVALPAQRFDETETGDAKAMVFTLTRGEAGAPPQGALDADVLDGIVDEQDKATLAGFGTGAAAQEAARRAVTGRSLAVRIIRDYGLMDRREAPQFHEPVVR